MASDLKDVSSSTFGYVIAYLLPGFLAIYALSIWYSPLRSVFESFATAESTAGIFFLVLLGALLIGVELMAFRWVLFDCWLCRRHRLKPIDFEKLSTNENMNAFQIIVDQHYRYHQFWGALTLVLPFVFWGAARQQGIALYSIGTIVVVIVAAIFEVVTVCAALDAYRNYVARARAILK
jgi:hypothetical protein